MTGYLEIFEKTQVLSSLGSNGRVRDVCDYIDFFDD